MLDVGTDDRLGYQTRALHRCLAALGIAHEYAEYPGAHDWGYWREQGPRSLAWLAAHVGSAR
jgi:enterochelin esterase-like enzyme